MIFEGIAQKLADAGWAHVSDFIDREWAAAILDGARIDKANGLFKPAGVGRRSALEERLRRDEILWLDEQSMRPETRRAYQRLDEFRLAMNELLFLGLRDFEAHLAHYGVGAYYAKHYDRFRDDDRRTLSMIVYLNPDWKTEDGGLLKLSLPEGEQTILPEAGSMICFLSDRIEHEVTLSHRERWSLTAWFKRSPKAGSL